jgi:adenylate kinase
MEVISAETRESYDEEIVVELRSDGQDEGEIDENVKRIEEWCLNWIKDNENREAEPAAGNEESE